MGAEQLFFVGLSLVPLLAYLVAGAFTLRWLPRANGDYPTIRLIQRLILCLVLSMLLTLYTSIAIPPESRTDIFIARLLLRVTDILPAVLFVLWVDACDTEAMRFVFGLAVLTVLLLQCSQSHAYVLLGTKYDHTAITHSGMLGSYVSEGLNEWGQYSAITDGGAGSDIQLELAPLGGGFCGDTFPFGVPYVSAHIIIDSGCWASEDEVTRQRLVTHEIGHAIGIAHSNVLGGLMEPRQATGEPHGAFSCDDAAAVAAIYPAGKSLSGCRPIPLPPTEEPGPASTPTPAPAPRLLPETHRVRVIALAR